MKVFGHGLIWIGFLIGAFLSVAQPEGLDVGLFLGALALGAVGVAVVRVGTRREARHEDKLEADMATLDSSLARVVADVEALDRDKEELGVYGLRHRIDETFPEDLAAFVAARESIAHRFGLQAYADVMNHFAAAERYLNRVWSASTDGYIDEAFEYIGRAHGQFDAALAALRAVAAQETRPEAQTGGPAP